MHQHAEMGRGEVDFDACFAALIDGARREGTGPTAGPVTDPATGEVTAQVSLATEEEAQAAVASAAAAPPVGGTPRWSWRASTRGCGGGRWRAPAAPAPDSPATRRPR